MSFSNFLIFWNFYYYSVSDFRMNFALLALSYGHILLHELSHQLWSLNSSYQILSLTTFTLHNPVRNLPTLNSEIRLPHTNFSTFDTIKIFTIVQECTTSELDYFCNWDSWTSMCAYGDICRKMYQLWWLVQ